MEKFATKDQSYYYSGITCVTVNGKRAYELKGKFLDDLCDNAFSGTNGEDATYKDYKNELNDDLEETWSKDGVPYEICDHICEPFCFKNGKTKWPTCNLNEDGFCDGVELPWAKASKGFEFPNLQSRVNSPGPFIFADTLPWINVDPFLPSSKLSTYLSNIALEIGAWFVWEWLASLEHVLTALIEVEG
ncbi:hypothetical protein Tco_0499360 [Tanacetum coccineum]